MRIIDGRTIEVDCDSCASTFTTGRGEDGEPDEILCSECKEAWQELRAEISREIERTWWEGFIAFLKQPTAPARVLADLDWADWQAREQAAWEKHQQLMDAADQHAYYSPEWRDDDAN